MQKMKVKYTCSCGESYILRGIYHINFIDTGFKQCVCGNSDLSSFQIEVLENLKKKQEVG